MSGPLDLINLQEPVRDYNTILERNFFRLADPVSIVATKGKEGEFIAFPLDFEIFLLVNVCGLFLDRQGKALSSI